MVRGVLGRKHVRAHLRRVRRRHALWRLAVRVGRPRIIIGAIARKIQLPYRLRLQVPCAVPTLSPTSLSLSVCLSPSRLPHLAPSLPLLILRNGSCGR